jgi:hypothetical protein
VPTAATGRIEDSVRVNPLQELQQERFFDLQAAGPIGHHIKYWRQLVVKGRSVQTQLLLLRVYFQPN